MARAGLRSRAAFGDYQTPISLAREVVSTPSLRNLTPSSVVEPTCGTGNFVLAAISKFASIRQVFALDINSDHIRTLARRLREAGVANGACLTQDDFFATDWHKVLRQLAEPILIIGNPPWVTVADLGSLSSSNAPARQNHQKLPGIDALTGKSNFDISESILLRMIESLEGKRATLAMLCKTTVARKVLGQVWKRRMPLTHAEIRHIDARTSFGIAVDACLLICSFNQTIAAPSCLEFAGLSDDTPDRAFGLVDGILVSDSKAYEKWIHLQGHSPYHWRSGIKHDCAKVMEFRQSGRLLVNGFGQIVDIEDEYVFPMAKASDVRNGRLAQTHRRVLVTQTNLSQDTDVIKRTAPRTWAYLQAHSTMLDSRASSIYKRRPRFSMFGVGDYSFSTWKVAVASLYKELKFEVIGPREGKPVLLDDTCYFLPCAHRLEAETLADMFNSETAREFFSAFTFWDAKRPITIGILERLNVVALAHELGQEGALSHLQDPEKSPNGRSHQLPLLNLDGPSNKI